MPLPQPSNYLNNLNSSIVGAATSGLPQTPTPVNTNPISPVQSPANMSIGTGGGTNNFFGPTTQPVVSPVVKAPALGATTPAVIPPPVTSNGAMDKLVTNNAGVFTGTQTQGKDGSVVTTFSDGTNNAPPPQETSQNKFSKMLTDLSTKIGGKGQALIDAEAASGVPQNQQALRDLETKQKNIALSFNKRVQDIYGNGAITREQAQQDVQELQRQQSFEDANLAIKHQALSGDINGAIDTATKLVNAQFEQYDAQLQNLKAQIDLNQHNMTDKETFQAKAVLEQQQAERDHAWQITRDAKLHQYGLSEIAARNGTTSSSSAGGSSANIPSALAPYVSTSSNGVKYMDASTLQGTAKEKTALINQASELGLKVITNKNSSADIVNIQDANSKLDTIQGIMANLGQPSWLQRTLGGLGLTKLAALTQSNPQKAAAGALQSVGLDILKAISGVQGFRGNQTAVQQVTDHLPKITDTTDVINQKIDYIKQLISSREDAIVGQAPNGQSTGFTVMTGPAGTFSVPADKVAEFKQNGYK